MRGLIAALELGYAYKRPELVVDHLVIGGGVVGLAIAQRLSEKYPAKSTYLVERHERAGEEISSRNSEVIHGGLYYPPNSLKTRLCIRGRELMYARCKSHSIPHRKLGKLVVATSSNPSQTAYLEKLQAHCAELKPPRYSSLNVAVPTKLISGDQARELEPDLSKDIILALHSPETGVVDSHALMGSLEVDVENSEGGQLVYGTEVVRVDPASEEDVKSEGDGWVVQTITDGSRDSDSILAKTLINASGLASHQILNGLLSRTSSTSPPIPIYYARGSYAKYTGPGVGNVQRLIYPVPEDGGKHSFHGLGTHLTLDMNGGIRFGPDIEWLEPPNGEEGSPDIKHRDYWARHLVPASEHLEQMHQTITSYLPNIVLSGLSPDYVGIRPKLTPPGGFNDFIVRVDRTGKFNGGKTRKTNEYEGARMVTLMGIESPGLTSSLALSEMVVDEVLYSEHES
ncbi:hypothetical protein FRB94_001347 [Tulasnella sp. JGI-2019a]|nr:hypothetical protein FRB93_000621 [Tulasnella sp. JGI-2019a]KAG9005704.1 hypothetical protein FRB94_001347 [Tulasnella sp. JGI-2019a]